ncbi:RNA-dependent RNA polymerase [Erysiphe necator associated ourmia-like virus 88]|nr:RNA-dependent RNA polymerase [Erysiphe necator associated ourmia-like virus 88]
MKKTKQTLNDFVCHKLAARWVVRGNTDTRALPKQTFDSLVKIERFRVLLNSCYAVNLEPVRRDDWSVPNLKRFCDGILDRDTAFHSWRSSLLQQHACRKTRVGVAASVFLFRKVLPSEMSKSEKLEKLDAYIKKMSTPSPMLDLSFASFAYRETRRIFKKHWDRGWEKSVEGFTLPVSSCIENRKSAGGARNLDRGKLRGIFRYFTDGGQYDLGQDTVPMIVPTGGKNRLVTKFSCLRSFLKPLHSIMYRHLTDKTDWCLRGDVTPEKVAGFDPVEGEIFVSGDYESASDNLNMNLTRVMMRAIQSTSTYVPASVWDAASASLSSRFPNGARQQHGQMMGSLLCFPLLCLANYLSFKYTIRRPVPLLINGDDIVFRCRTNEKDEWVKSVGKSGLVLSVGKTMFHRSVFSLNSTYFVTSKSNGPRFAPFIRSSCLFDKVEDCGEVAGRLKGCVVGTGVFRDRVQTFLLNNISSGVFSTQRSLRRGMGCSISTRAIRWSQLDRREEFYLSFPSEPSIPLRKSHWMHNSIPDGYVRSVGVPDCESYSHDMVETTWSRGPISTRYQKDDEYWEYVREGTYRYNPFSAYRFWTMAGGVGEIPRSTLQCARPQKMGWRKQNEGGIAFVSAGFQ